MTLCLSLRMPRFDRPLEQVQSLLLPHLSQRFPFASIRPPEVSYQSAAQGTNSFELKDDRMLFRERAAVLSVGCEPAWPCHRRPPRPDRRSGSIDLPAVY